VQQHARILTVPRHGKRGEAMDEMMQDYCEAMARIYSRMANIALDKGEHKLSDELWNKSLDWQDKANA